MAPLIRWLAALATPFVGWLFAIVLVFLVVSLACACTAAARWCCRVVERRRARRAVVDAIARQVGELVPGQRGGER